MHLSSLKRPSEDGLLTQSATTERQPIRGYELPLPDCRCPGNVLVDVDYGRMELRILAARSRDSAMLARCDGLAVLYKSRDLPGSLQPRSKAQHATPIPGRSARPLLIRLTERVPSAPDRLNIVPWVSFFVDRPCPGLECDS